MKKYALINASRVSYSRLASEVRIDDLIEALTDAKAEGATHVVGLSGNYRGAKYVHLGMPEIEIVEED